MLKHRHYNIGDDHGCILSGLRIEVTVEHIFFECQFHVLCWVSLHLSWPSGGARLQNITSAKDPWGRPLFMEVFLLAAWSIWKERNNKHFRGIVPTMDGWSQRFKCDFGMMRHRVKEALVPFVWQVASLT